MDIKIKPGDLQGAVENILREYGDQVYVATDEGLAAAEKVLIANLKAATPVANPAKMPRGYKDKKFRASWKGTGKKYKLMRFVGNSATVSSKKNDSISLADIFEYSKKGHPFIKKTFEDSVGEMAAAVVATIKKGV